MHAQAFSLSIFVPAYNEEENLAPTVDNLLQALKATVGEFEIIIVDDGSTDRTAEIAGRLQANHPQVRFLRQPSNQGLAAGYVRAMNEARMNYFVFIPGDNCWPLPSLLSLFGTFGKADIVVCYTTNPEIRPWLRRSLSSTYTRILNLLSGRRLHYYNGLTIYPLSFLRSISIKSRGFDYMAETLLQGIQQGLSFVEIGMPITERTSGRSKALTVKNFISAAKMFVRVFRRFRTHPDSRRRDGRSD